MTAAIAGTSTFLHELNPDLSIGAPRHAAATPEPEGELFWEPTMAGDP